MWPNINPGGTNMELQAKETRMIILGLKKLLADTQAQFHALSDDDDDYAFLANDATLIDSMIAGFEEEYRQKFN
jgi:hypothetical protein